MQPPEHSLFKIKRTRKILSTYYPQVETKQSTSCHRTLSTRASKRARAVPPPLRSFSHPWWRIRRRSRSCLPSRWWRRNRRWRRSSRRGRTSWGFLCVLIISLLNYNLRSYVICGCSVFFCKDGLSSTSKSVETIVFWHSIIVWYCL